jgi:hypothetical protein
MATTEDWQSKKKVIKVSGSRVYVLDQLEWNEY